MALVELTASHRRAALPDARRAACSTCAAAGCSATAASAPPYWQDHAAGPRGARRSPGTRCASCTSTAGRSTSRSRLGDQDLLAAVQPALDGHGRAPARTSPAALGSRHRDEAFGDPYELPPDRAYAETCAAIASVMLGWRLLLATGEARFADAIERTMFNGVCSAACRSTGRDFFYVNPLQRRSSRSATTQATARGSRGTRAPAARPTSCASSRRWQQYLATADDGRESSSTSTPRPTSRRRSRRRGPARDRDGLPVGGPRHGPHVETPDAAVDAVAARAAGCRSRDRRRERRHRRRSADAGRRLRRSWAAGDVVSLDLELPATVTPSDRRIDADPGLRRRRARPDRLLRRDRGSPGRRRLEDVEVDPAVTPEPEPRDDLARGLVGLALPGSVAPGRPQPRPSPCGRSRTTRGRTGAPEAMRVWIPATHRRS